MLIILLGLAWMSVLDLRHRRVPNRYSLGFIGGCALGAILNLFLQDPVFVQNLGFIKELGFLPERAFIQESALARWITLGQPNLYWWASLLVVLLFTLPGYRKGVVGGADIKLLLGLALLFSPYAITLIIAMAFGLFCLYWCVAFRHEQEAPFVPALCLAVLLHTAFF